MNLGDRLRHLIEEKKVTAYEVALKTGISQATLSRVLNDNTAKMSIKTIDVLTQYFNIKKDWLVTLSNRKEVPGFSIRKKITKDDEWCAEAYLETNYSDITEEEFEKQLKKYWAFKTLNK